MFLSVLVSWLNLLNNEYFFRYLNLLKGIGFFSNRRSQSSVNSVFNASLAAKIPVFLPPIPEQTGISAILLSADRQLEAAENRKAALQALFKTILNQLMTGKMRVKDLEAMAALTAHVYFRGGP